MRQIEWVIEALRKGPITPLDALNGCGCMRLAVHIHELRSRGYGIFTRLIENENGKPYAQYTLTHTPRAEPHSQQVEELRSL